MDAADMMKQSLDDEDVYFATVQAARFSKVSTLKALIRDIEKMVNSKREKVHVLRRRNQESAKKRQKTSIDKERTPTLDDDHNEEVLYSDDSGVTYHIGEFPLDDEEEEEEEDD